MHEGPKTYSYILTFATISCFFNIHKCRVYDLIVSIKNTLDREDCREAKQVNLDLKLRVALGRD